MRLATAALLAFSMLTAAPLLADETADRIATLIEQLGHTDYDQREAAEKQLTEIGPKAIAALREAGKSEDAEVRVRAERILNTIGEAGDRYDLIWRVAVPKATGSLSLHEDELRLPTTKANLVLDPATGTTLREKKPIQLDLPATVCPVGERAYVIKDGKLQLHDLKDNKLSEVALKDETARALAADDTHVYVLGTKHITAHRQGDLSQVWQREFVGREIGDTLLIDGKHLFIIAGPGLAMLDAKDGDIRWHNAHLLGPSSRKMTITVDGEKIEYDSNAPRGRIAREGDRVFVTRDSRVVAVDVKSGRTLWTMDPFNPDKPAEATVGTTRAVIRIGIGGGGGGAPAPGGGGIIIGGIAAPDTTDLKRLTLDLPVTASDGVVMVGITDGLIAFDSATGKRLWKLGTKTRVSQPAVVKDGTVYVVSDPADEEGQSHVQALPLKP